MARRPAALTALALAAAACQPSSGRNPVPRAYLFQKGPYQAVYGPDGRILRLLYDGNGDAVADVVTLFGPYGKPRQVETDSDLDGVVDRWESHGAWGVLEKAARSRAKPGTPDLWEFFDGSGAVIRRELDEDGDRKLDRIEYFEAGRLARVELDTDRDGRVDRWQEWKSGRLLGENVDTNSDGTADRRLRYGEQGELLGLAKLN